MSERLKRWRLILGGEEADGTGEELAGADLKRDKTLDALYGEEKRRGGLGGSSPRVARWLGDIRGYFPASVVQVMQRDAMDRLGLRQLLLEPELLESVQPDVHLVGTLLSLNQAIPERSRETARAVVREVVDELERRLAQPTRQAVGGALHRAGRTSRPRAADIDWNRTILANLKHYQPEHGTVIPERLVGYGRRLPQVSREIVLCLDQSGSMASSVVYAGVFGAVLASIRSVRTQIVAFDTAVADLTDLVTDPVELLFGVQLGGGTDINSALAYCQTRIENPRDTIFVLISDLYEGGDNDEMLRRAQAMAASDMQVVCLLALSDDGAPSYDHDNAAALAAMGIPTFACTPDQFPDLIAAAIQRDDLAVWAGNNDIQLAVPDGT
ncbi:MAG TPA: VWA domain-containing protein [Actinophytocola sp.]|uniref:VWA domain-containing protein n=1 Tax=Actinophytocola sp. TaxID=1872138 RepID=UPI002F93CB79